MKSMETGRQDGGSDKNHAPFSVGKTGNISRKFLTIILKIFDKNFERLHPTDQEILENIYLQNLKKRSMSTSERMQRKIRQKCAANDEAERRLSAAVEIIQSVKDVKQKDRLIRHVEGMLELAGCK